MITISIEDKKKEYRIEDVKKKEPFIVKNKKYSVEVTTTGYYRQLEIKDVEIEKIIKSRNNKKLENNFLYSPLNQEFTKMILEKKTRMSAKINLRGVGVSIVNKEPKEILYLSLYGLEVGFGQETLEKNDTNQIEMSLELNLKLNHFQIDNMANDENPIIIAPFKALVKDEEIEDNARHRLLVTQKKPVQNTPFIDVNVIFLSSAVNKVVRKKIDEIKIKIQPIMIQLETGILMIILSTVMEIADVFSNEEVEYLSAHSIEAGKNKFSKVIKGKTGINMVEEAKILKQNLKNVPDDSDSSFDEDLFDKATI